VKPWRRDSGGVAAEKKKEKEEEVVWRMTSRIPRRVLQVLQVLQVLVLQGVRLMEELRGRRW